MFLFQSVYLVFPCLVALAKTFHNVNKQWWEGTSLSLFLVGKLKSFPPLDIVSALGCFVDVLYQERNDPFIPTLMIIFVMNDLNFPT